MKMKKNGKWYYFTCVILVVTIVFCTSYAFILPVAAMEKTQEALDCPLCVHHHTEECYDSEGSLICGQADFVVHTHDEKCYDKDGTLVCELPEIQAHEHTDSCYEEQRKLVCEIQEHVHEEDCYQTKKTLICGETAVLHTHDERCYDESGALICGMLQVIRHEHEEGCFKTVKQTEALVAQNDVISVAETAEGASQIWGYNDDGSIWWSNITLTSVASGAIETDTPYVISGSERRNVLTDTSMDSSQMQTAQPGSSSDYVQYAIWYFERDEGSGGYRIYTMNSSGTDKRYLNLNGVALSLVDTSENAAVFTVEAASTEKYPSCVAIKAGEYYINTYGEDRGCRGWGGWNESGGGSILQILKVEEDKQTANPISTVSSPNTVINLFDYWISDNQTDRDDVEPNTTNQMFDKGINNGHVFKFSRGDVAGSGNDEEAYLKLNNWTGKGQNPLQGIVQNKLDENRYPVLSETYNVTGYPTTESLEYLFNPESVHEGKASYRNVKDLFYIDDQGYYCFSSKNNMAEFNEETKSFRVYDRPGAKQNFYPFCKAPEIMDAARDDAAINHYFGMTLTSRFVQLKNGFVDDKNSIPITFDFSGDDDVWIFIDGVLVGDVGGIHDASSVSIDFSTGAVEVCVNGGTNPIKTTLYECYEKAGKTEATNWKQTAGGNKIYEDQTVHTLKFFYLERGNYDSNLNLKYNLADIPETAIYKINQYGEPVKDATFAVYAADENYKMLSKKDGTEVTAPAEPHYDADGNLTAENGDILAEALYTGTTNGDGKMVFTDADGMPYSVNELEDMFGQFFILREIGVPDGYRIVSPDVHLEFWSGKSQTIMRCANMFSSGARAATTLQVTATDKLQLQRAYNGMTTIDYCDDSGNINGTLFAVIFKYTGEIVDGKATAPNDATAWTPVWGSDEDGYSFVPLNPAEPDQGIASIAAAIDAAKATKEKYGTAEDIEFSLSSNGEMKLTKKNLPGRISSYFRMLGEENIEAARYAISYYWTDGTLDNATTDNTRRIITKADVASSSIARNAEYSDFETIFGADIQVPNLYNKLYVQKMDENENRINGATFAIYKVQQLNDEAGTLQAQDTSGAWVTFPKEAIADEETGAITNAEGNVIMPLDIDITKEYTDGIHTGTAEFAGMSEGQYIIKEIQAPPGYSLNKSDVMVLVTEDTIYANAGTEEDGVAVGRGPGYLVAPLAAYASEGYIDNTLTWMYARMLISPPNNKFADATNPNLDWKYLTENNTGKGGTKEEAAICYLRYSLDEGERAADGRAFNYVANTDRTVEHGAQNPTGMRRLFTTVGWNHYAMLQDYDYGLEKCRETGANYENWAKSTAADGSVTDINLMHLFSRSTYIRVTDVQETTLSIKKVAASDENTGLSGAGFRLYKLGESNEKLYYAWNEEAGTVTWTETVGEALTVTTGEDGKSDKDFLKLSDNTYYLEETKAPDGYYKLKEPVKLVLKNAKLTADSENLSGGQNVRVNEGVLDEENRYTYTVNVSNSVFFEMPETGGDGIILHITGGLFMMVVSLVYGYRKKSRWERRTK